MKMLRERKGKVSDENIKGKKRESDIDENIKGKKKEK